MNLSDAVGDRNGAAGVILCDSIPRTNSGAASSSRGRDSSTTDEDIPTGHIPVIAQTSTNTRPTFIITCISCYDTPPRDGYISTTAVHASANTCASGTAGHDRSAIDGNGAETAVLAGSDTSTAIAGRGNSTTVDNQVSPICGVIPFTPSLPGVPDTP